MDRRRHGRWMHGGGRFCSAHVDFSHFQPLQRACVCAKSFFHAVLALMYKNVAIGDWTKPRSVNETPSKCARISTIPYAKWARQHKD